MSLEGIFLSLFSHLLPHLKNLFFLLFILLANEVRASEKEENNEIF